MTCEKTDIENVCGVLMDKSNVLLQKERRNFLFPFEPQQTNVKKKDIHKLMLFSHTKKKDMNN
jgi:hypothetical protein